MAPEPISGRSAVSSLAILEDQISTGAGREIHEKSGEAGTGCADASVGRRTL
jgi:hypothetical protein